MYDPREPDDVSKLLSTLVQAIRDGSDPEETLALYTCTFLDHDYEATEGYMVGVHDCAEHSPYFRYEQYEAKRAELIERASAEAANSPPPLRMSKPPLKVDLSVVGREYLRALNEQQVPPPIATVDPELKKTWDAFHDLAHGTLYQRALREPDLAPRSALLEQLERRAVAAADAAVSALLAQE